VITGRLASSSDLETNPGKPHNLGLGVFVQIVSPAAALDFVNAAG
jgi:hypothetical protein